LHHPFAHYATRGFSDGTVCHPVFPHPWSLAVHCSFHQQINRCASGGCLPGACTRCIPIPQFRQTGVTPLAQYFSYLFFAPLAKPGRLLSHRLAAGFNFKLRVCLLKHRYPGSPKHLASRHYLSSDLSAFSFGLGLQAFKPSA